ncbi:MAG: hypothetical protein IKI75_02800 [Lachnospiraceae bacterium]|nr:hypothetical protein [Lachnospiraceae bacterium]
MKALDEVRKQEQREELDRAKFRKRRYRLKAKRLATAAIIVLAVLVTAFIMLRAWKNRSYTEMVELTKAEWSLPERARVIPYGSDFITYSADGIHCSNSLGDDVWSLSYIMQEPEVKVNGNYVAVADRGGRTIYVCDKSGKVGEISTGSPVQDICVSAGGVVAAVLDESSVTPVCLYYHDGTRISYFRTTMSRSGYPAAIGISPDGKLVGVSYFYTDNGHITSKLAFYNFGEVGKNEADNLVSGYDYQSEIVPMVEFMDDEAAFAVANDRLMFYSGSQRPVNTANIMLREEIRSVYYGKEYVGLVYYDRSGEGRYRLDVYNRKGEQESSIILDMEYSDIVFTGDRILVYNASGCVIYTAKGIKRYEGSFSEPVYLCMPTASELKYVLVTGDGISSVQLR